MYIKWVVVLSDKTEFTILNHNAISRHKKNDAHSPAKGVDCENTVIGSWHFPTSRFHASPHQCVIRLIATAGNTILRTTVLNQIYGDFV
jgi:hypothetical protein